MATSRPSVTVAQVKGPHLIVESIVDDIVVYNRFHPTTPRMEGVAVGINRPA